METKLDKKNPAMSVEPEKGSPLSVPSALPPLKSELSSTLRFAEMTLEFSEASSREMAQVGGAEEILLAQAGRPKGRLRPSAKSAKPEGKTEVPLTFNKLNEKATIKYQGTQISIYRWKEGGFRYQVSGSPEVTYVPFSGAKGFGRAMSNILNETFGEKRPQWPKAVNLIYRQLKLVSGDAGIEPMNSERVADIPKFVKDINNDKGEIQLGKEKVLIEKSTPKGVKLTLSSDNSQSLFRFDNLEGFRRRSFEMICSGLELNCTPTQKQLLNVALIEAYNQLNLGSVTGTIGKGKNENLLTSKDRVLDLPHGKYTLNDEGSPATYMLVRHAVTGNNYCLGTVQSIFDMMYGLGAARKAGLYDKSYAMNLDLSNSSEVTVQKFDSKVHKNLPAGTLLRLERPLGLRERIFSSTPPSDQPGFGLTHIAISLGNNRIAHLVGSSFYIEPLSNIQKPYVVKEVITPGKEFKTVSQAQTISSLYFDSGSRLEVIAKAIQEQYKLPNKSPQDLVPIEEAIYDLNRAKFNVVNGGRTIDTKLREDWHVELTSPGKIEIPEYWKTSNPKVIR